MKKDKNDDIYTDDMGDGPSDNAVVVKDFLPPPEVLAKALTRIKITIDLTKPSLDFFKREAEKHDVSYQAMIRELLDTYAARAGKD